MFSYSFPRQEENAEAVLTCNFESTPNSMKSMHAQTPDARDNSPSILSLLNPNLSLTSLYNFPETDLRQEYP